MKATKESTSLTGPPRDRKNGVVQYDHDGAMLLGVVTGVRKEKCKLINIRGREIELAQQRLHFLPGSLAGDDDTLKTKVTRLEELNSLIEARAKSIDVEELWGFVRDDLREYSVEELCELYFGADELVDHAALRLAFVAERVHFKRTKNGFEPRSASIAAGLRQAEEAKAARVEQQKEAISFMEARLCDSTLEPPASVCSLIGVLKEIAAESSHIEPAQLREAKEFLKKLAERLKLGDISAPEKCAYEVLRSTGLIDEHCNLSFVRHHIDETFSDEINALAREVTLKPDEGSFRLDYTAAEVFTVDDSSTRDMDDALSIERIEDGFELGIHITDVSAAFDFGSELDNAARSRATSIYCADRVVNMLPDILSETRLSLIAGEIRPCLSVFITLSEDLQLLSSRVEATQVKVTTRYSYDQVDDLLEHGDKTFLRLYEVASIHEARRLARGAVKVHKREVVPHYKDSRVTLQEVNEESPARSLVAEMMVLANSVFAQYAIDHQIPVWFRGQEPPAAVSSSVASLPEGPARDFQARTSLKKSSVSLEPRPHAGLGLPCYIQCTSPIRRYMDLCHQRQFVSFLRDGKPAMDSEAFLKLANEVEGPLSAASRASRETKRYWLLTYLAQRDRELPIRATVVRTDLKSPLVELDEVFITVLVKLGKGYQPGMEVELKLCSVDPRADYLRLQEI
jgi:exoribonuclease-2